MNYSKKDFLSDVNKWLPKGSKLKPGDLPAEWQRIALPVLQREASKGYATAFGSKPPADMSGCTHFYSLFSRCTNDISYQLREAFLN